MEDSIKLYSSPTCPKCKMLKLELGKSNIQFEECHDTEEMSKLGIVSIPVLSVNGKLLKMQEAVAWLKEKRNA